jgi:hypothetical protein
MAKRGKTCDVLISHAAKDSSLAQDIADACRENGLETAIDAELLSGPNASDALWEALAESRALVTILAPSGLTPWMIIEIGAAGAWNKPIFGIITDPSITRLPSGLTGIRPYTTGRLQDVINEIKLSARELTEEDRAFLTGIPAKMGVSVEQLALDPRRREEIVKAFRKGRGKTVSEERLLSELLRLRKQGKFVRSRSVGRSNPSGEST